MQQIQFFTEDVNFKLSNKSKITSWIDQIISQHDRVLDQLSYIICSDNYLLNINQQYLSHDYLTDIITFDNSEDELTIEADIFISIDRVKDNAKNLGLKTQDEFHRVLIHGVLHLLGWKDKTNSQKILMREKEEACLSLLKI